MLSSIRILSRQSLHVSASLLKKPIDYSRVPVLGKDDIEEKFVRGSGPGGQAVSKTSNACMIRHIPTGIIVKCHIHRQLTKNQKEARKILINKLDNFYNKEMSVENQMKAQEVDKSSKQNQKRRKLQDLKQKWQMENEKPTE